MKLSIAAKFNIVFLSIFAVGFGAASLVTNYLLQRNAREETLQSARVLMLQSALAARSYTAAQIVPLLETRLKYEFLPQSIPSFAATEQLGQLLKQYPDFSYKEATLNPTNLRDRAADWEADLSPSRLPGGSIRSASFRSRKPRRATCSSPTMRSSPPVGVICTCGGRRGRS